jgi:hypothetical protein
MSNWIRAYWWLGVAVICALVMSRVEALTSHFWLCQLITLTIGFALGAIHVAIRKRAMRARKGARQ